MWYRTAQFKSMDPHIICWCLHTSSAILATIISTALLLPSIACMIWIPHPACPYVSHHWSESRAGWPAFANGRPILMTQLRGALDCRLLSNSLATRPRAHGQLITGRPSHDGMSWHTLHSEHTAFTASYADASSSVCSAFICGSKRHACPCPCPYPYLWPLCPLPKAVIPDQHTAYYTSCLHWFNAYLHKFLYTWPIN